MPQLRRSLHPVRIRQAEIDERPKGCYVEIVEREHSTPTRISGPALNNLLSRREEFLRFLGRRVGSREVAEDLLQSALLRSIDSADITDEVGIVIWFYRVLRNAVIDYYRKNASAAKALECFARELQDAHVPSPDLRNEVCHCVIEVLNDLKPEYKEMLAAADMEERPLAEVAAKAEISANNAAVRLHRARQALRKQVRLTCGVCAEHGCVDCRCKSGCQR